MSTQWCPSLINIAESILKAEDNIGANISLETRLTENEILFGECQSVIIITLDQSDLIKLMSFSKNDNLHVQTIGRVTDDAKLNINNLINIDKSELKHSYFNYYGKLLNIK